MSFTVVVNNGFPVLFFQQGGLFWMCLQNEGASNGSIQVWSSPDGVTWTHRDGADESVTVSGFAATFDGAHTVTAVFQQGNFSGNLFLQQFNLNTMTWGAPFAEQSGITLEPFFIGQQSGGNFIVLSQDNSANPVRCKAQVWNGATWSAAVDVTAGAEALSGFNSLVTVFDFAQAVIDASNIVHVIYGTFSSDPAWNRRYFYQELTATDVLQHFQEFAGQTPPNQDLAAFGSQPGPNLFINGTSIYWGILRNNYSSGPPSYPSAYVGTPLVNPVWSELGNLDPAALASQRPISAPVWALNTTTGQLWEAYNRLTPDAAGGQVQLLLGGNSLTLSDSEHGGATVAQYGPLFAFGGGVFMATGALVVEGPPVATVFTPVSASASYQVKITLRGVNRRRCD
jgi:hypothetical protein